MTVRVESPWIGPVQIRKTGDLSYKLFWAEYPCDSVEMTLAKHIPIVDLFDKWIAGETWLVMRHQAGAVIFMEYDGQQHSVVLMSEFGRTDFSDLFALLSRNNADHLDCKD